MNPNILKRSQMTQDRHRKLETQNQIGAVTRPTIQDLGSRSLICFSTKFGNTFNKNILNFLLRCLKNTPTSGNYMEFPLKISRNSDNILWKPRRLQSNNRFQKHSNKHITTSGHGCSGCCKFAELLHNCATFYKFWVRSGTYVWQC